MLRKAYILQNLCHSNGDVMNQTAEKIKKMFTDIILSVDVELGRRFVSVGEMLSWDKGTILKLPKTSGESVDFIVSKKPMAVGEIMVIDEKFAVRITDIHSKTNISEMCKDGLYDF